MVIGMGECLGGDGYGDGYGYGDGFGDGYGGGNGYGYGDGGSFDHVALAGKEDGR